MTDPAAFALARIAEREAKARAATPGPWRHNPNKVNALDDEESVFAGPPGRAAITVASTGPADDAPSMIDADHIALWDPAAVLARCAVDRQIVALHRLYDGQTYRETPCCERCTAAGEYPADDAYTDEKNWPCPTLRLLLSLDADHPDYDEDWTL